MPRTALAERFAEHVAARGLLRPGQHVLVALSGGLDSLVLLHLLRFALRDLPLRITAAHFDHAMRAGSAADAHWVRGLCRAWDVPLVSARAGVPLRGESAARVRNCHVRGNSGGDSDLTGEICGTKGVSDTNSIREERQVSRTGA